MSTIAVILAGGEGKRMKSEKPKVLHEVLFKPMIDWVLDAVKAAGIDAVCVVTGYAHDMLEKHLEGRGFAVAYQARQLGTGHAAMQAVDFLKSSGAEDVVILSGDVPLIGAEIISASYAAHRRAGSDMTIITAQVPDPTGYGRVVRCGNAARIVEEKDATAAERAIAEIATGAYWFKAAALLDVLPKLRNNNAQGEYYLTDAAAALSESGRTVGTFMADDFNLMAGANDRKQLAMLNAAARRMILDRLYAQGVTVTDEAGVTIGPDAVIGRDTVILPGTIIRGRCSIGCGCVIGPNALIENCELSDKVVFNASQAYFSKIGRGVTVGPFCHIRPGTVLKDMVHVGDFVEIKNSNIGEGTKVPHLTYVGDSDVGRGVNFGCGCVTSNYDGVAKHRTVVRDNAFIGCNTNLVAPVEVGENAYTAAGSTITKDVPANALGVARARQENIIGWVERKRSKK